MPAKFVAFILGLDADGHCQRVKVGATSPGPVLDEEIIARFVFAPTHLSKDGDEINETLFSDAFTIGASVNRLAAQWEQALPALCICAAKRKHSGYAWAPVSAHLSRSGNTWAWSVLWPGMFVRLALMTRRPACGSTTRRYLPPP